MLQALAAGGERRRRPAWSRRRRARGRLRIAQRRARAHHPSSPACWRVPAFFDADALECGKRTGRIASRSSGRWPRPALIEPSALHNNCSGKHAGFLCLALPLWPKACRPAPLRRRATSAPITRVMQERDRGPAGHDRLPSSRPPRARTDGCSIPTYAIPAAPPRPPRLRPRRHRHQAWPRPLANAARRLLRAAVALAIPSRRWSAAAARPSIPG